MEMNKHQLHQAEPPNLGCIPYHVYNDMHFKIIPESTNPGRVQDQTYAAHNSSSNGVFNENWVNETPFVTSEHSIPPLPPATSIGGRFVGLSRKAPRTGNACTGCRSLKAKCSGDYPTCCRCKEKDSVCVYEEVPPPKIEKTDELVTKIDVRTQEMDVRIQEMEKILRRLLADRESAAEAPVKTSAMPQHEPAVRRINGTAASSILSYDFVRKVVGNVVEEDDENAETIWRESSLYIKHINILYPILTPTQLESLIQDFIRTNSISNTTSEQSAGLKRKRPGPELPQSPIERALVLLIRALGKKYDNALSVEYEVSPGGLTIDYPTPKYAEKAWTATSLDENSSFKTRITGVTPGSEYFAAATDNMVKQFRGSSMCHVQVYLLASIYHGQLAQDAQRHHYLFEAARALRMFLQSKVKQFESTGWELTVIFIFWTHRLLEGELVAEQALAESDLHVWEETVPFPDIEQTDAFMIQLQLRKHLGAIDAELYQQACPKNLDIRMLDDQVELSNLYKTAERLYRRVGEIYKPHPIEADDPNPILTMRLNAKAAATMALSLRPCLEALLNRKDPDAKIPNLVSNYSKHCIRVLEYSIKSSNLIKDDPLITHAQWGNVIILLAAFSDVAVKHFIKHDLLRELVSQTQETLSAWPWSALEQDVRFLKDMALKTGLYQ